MSDAYTVLCDFPYGHAKKFLGLKNDPHTTGVIQATGEYSRAEVEVFERFIRPDDVAIDAGALFGAHTVPMAMLAGTVYAFEPQRIPFQVLCANLQLNSLANVHASQMALGVLPERAYMVEDISPYSPAAYWGMNRTASDFTCATPAHVSPGAVSVLRSTIDFECHSKLDFLKLDCEGDESKIVQGGRRTIQQCKPVIYSEFHDKAIAPLLKEMLPDSQLWFHDLPAQPGTPMLLCVPPDRVPEYTWLDRLKFQPII